MAQNGYTLIVQPADKSAEFIQQLKLNTKFSSQKDCMAYVSRLPSLLSSKGYVSASVDSVWNDSTTTGIHLFCGEKYLWQGLTFSEADIPLLHNLGYKAETFNNKPFDAQAVSKLYEDLLNYFEDNGYPFATVALDSLQLNNNLLTGRLNIDKGMLYKIDSIAITGTAKINSSYLYHYLGIEKGSLYNRRQLTRVNQRLQELPFLQQVQPWDVTMLNTGAVLNLYLNQKRSNEINALVGFLPANQQLGGKLLLTGEATLNLKNAFGAGETIGFNWQQIQPQSPRLDIHFQRPYLFSSLLGLDFNFQLFKKDSTFLNINAVFGVSYALSGRQSGKVFLQTASTNVLNVDTTLVKLTKQLPQVNDVSALNLGIEYSFNNTNYRYNPVSGNELTLMVYAGRKTVRRNNTISQLKDPDFDYNSLYDTVQLNAYQFRVKLNGARYFKTGRQSTVKTALQGGWYQSPNYFLNDLFQVGGYKLLRGFDEESIYSNFYAVATLEYRYLLAQNSYFFVFTDVGTVSFKTNSTSNNHSYIGTGIGLAFETGSGIFNISYAVGKRDDTRLDFRQSKIHLGFVSRF